MTLLALLLLVTIQFSLSDTRSNEKQFLDEGLKLEKQDRFEEALKLWSSATAELEIPSLKIATEFLRVATENKLTGYYRTASALHSWSLSKADSTALEFNKSAINEELDRLEILVGGDQKSKWKELLKENDPAIINHIRMFWEQLDLTPAKLSNERLIEHWQRMAYAKQNFGNESEPPFFTDKRGITYIKFGEPDSIHNGQLNLSPGEVNRAMTDFFTNSTRVARDGISNELRAFMRSIENAVMDYHYMSDKSYEIWIYDKPREAMEFNLIKIFGSKGGKFQELTSIDEMIPSSAFSMSNRHAYVSLAGVTDFDLTPGLIMQWLYYSKLTRVDNYFSDHFRRVNSELFMTNNENTSSLKYKGALLKQQNHHIAVQFRNSAPAEISTEEKALYEIPINIYQYRFINDNDKPVFITFFESKPTDALINDLAINQDMMFSSVDPGENSNVFGFYKYFHGLQLRDTDWNLIAQNRQNAPLVLDHVENTPSSSIFIIPYLEQEVTQVFYTELENTHPDTKPKEESLFPKALRGTGKVNLEQPDPLQFSAGELMVSDLLLGYQKSDELRENSLFNFVVSNNRHIPSNENLVVHFEVYGLQTDNDDIARFELNYEIEPRNRGLLGWTKGKSDEFNITLSFEEFGSRFKESLEIEAARLEPGEYKLKWVVKDLNGNSQFEREINFEVLDSSATASN